MRVPIFKEDLIWDNPLPRSVAVPLKATQAPVNIIQRKWGQSLTGDMIPIRYVSNGVASNVYFADNACPDRPTDRLLFYFREKNTVQQKVENKVLSSDANETDSLLVTEGSSSYGAVC